MKTIVKVLCLIILLQNYNYSQIQNIERDSGWVNVFPFGIQVFNLIQHPSKGNVLYLLTEDGIFVSENSGQFWHLQMLYDHLKPSVEMTRVTLNFDPTNDNTLFASACWKDGSNLWRSTDNGRRWDILGENLIQGSIWSIGIPPSQNQVIYVATSSGLFKSLNGGKSWGKIFNVPCWNLKTNLHDPNKIYFSAYTSSQMFTSIYNSSDAGKTFTEVKIQFVHTYKNEILGEQKELRGTDNVGGFSINPKNNDQIHAYCFDNGSEGVGNFIKSDDGGKTWTSLIDGVKNIVWDYGSENRNSIYAAYHEQDRWSRPILQKLLESKDGGATWIELSYPAIGTSTSLLSVVNSDKLILLADGIYKSVNDGQSWERIHYGLPSNTSGFSLLASNPFDSSFYVQAPGQGYWKSYQNGERWLFQSVKGKDSRDEGLQLSKVIVNADNSHYYLTKGHLFRQASSASDIEEISLPVFPYYITTLSSDGNQLLLIGEPNQGSNSNYYILSKSEDAGFSWTNIEWTQFKSRQQSPLAGSVVYISASPDGSEVIAVISDRILVSIDRGIKWTDISGNISKVLGNSVLRSSAGNLLSILFDTKDNKNIFLATQFGGIIQSTDGGITWKSFLTRKMSIYKNEIIDFANHSSSPNIFVVVTDLGIFISKDHGHSWKPMNNGIFPEDNIHKILPTTTSFVLEGSKGLYLLMNEEKMK